MSTNMALTNVNHQCVIINIIVYRYLVTETTAVDTSTGLCQLVKRINICMDKRKKKWGNICLFFADERYLRLSKICSFGNYVTICVLFV